MSRASRRSVPAVIVLTPFPVDSISTIVLSALIGELLRLLELAMAEKGKEHQADLGEWLPCRILVVKGEGVEEIWCALCIRGTDGAGVPESLRDLLFARLEQHLAPALFEPRNDWPTGQVDWFEVVVLGVR